MSIIRPISDLRNHADQISKLCHVEARPILITKNGKGDMVVMSLALFERQQALLDLYQKLDEAEEDSVKHPKGLPHKKMMRLLKDRLA